MKIIISLAAFGFACLLYSCNMPAGSGTSGGMDTAYINKIKNLNMQFYKGFEAGTLNGFDSTNVSSNVIDHGMGPKDVMGLDSVKKGLMGMISQMKDVKFNVLSIAVDSNYSTAWVEMTGTSTSPESGFPVGASIDMKTVDVVRWDNGKAAEHWGYVDPRDMMKMMPPSMPKDTTKH
jgi:predicted ester cyclase